MSRSARSWLYYAARTLGTARAARKGPTSLAKRLVRRKIYAKTNGQANAQAAYRTGTDPLYACSYDGLHPGNTSRWCAVGCGSDYNHMIAVPRETVRALFNFDFVKAN